MFTDPQTLTVAAVAKALPRVSTGDRTSTYESEALGYRLRLSHFLGKQRTRRTARFDSTKTAADPFLSGVTKQVSMSVLVSIDHPISGYTSTEIADITKAITDWLGTTANLNKVVGGES